MGQQRRMVTDADREEISRGIVEGVAGKVIAARIGRCPSVVSREITRHGGRDGYRAVAARRVAAEQRRRPKTRRLDRCPVLRAEVVGRLRAGHSPDQIAGRLRVDFPGEQAWRVSHEAIYTWIYALPKGQLGEHGILLRSGRTSRRPRRGRGAATTWVDGVSIAPPIWASSASGSRLSATSCRPAARSATQRCRGSRRVPAACDGGQTSGLLAQAH